MKRLFILTSFLFIFLLVSCTKPGDNPIDEEPTVKFTVTFDSNGGSPVASQEVEDGKMVVKPQDPTKEGYNFVYWYYTNEDIAYNFNLPVGAAFTLTAKWEEVGAVINKYTVIFDSKGGSEVNHQIVNENGKALEPQAPTRNGYIFVHWYTSNEDIAYDFNTPVTSNITLNAKWELDNSIDPELAIDLFISVYVEGNPGFRKAIQIFNGTGQTVDLSQYTVKLAANGGGWGGTPIQLSGTLPHLGIYVIRNNADGNFTADLTTSQLNHNGDDAIGLFKNDTLIDIFGVQGEDPGTGWSLSGPGNGSDTVDKVLVRSSATMGPSTTWDRSEWTIALAIPNADTDSQVDAILKGFTWDGTTVDNFAPEITLNPATNPVNLLVGAEWTIPVATATDNIDGNITALIEFDGSTIQSFLNSGKYVFTVQGTYEVTWSVDDSSGNTTSVTITINILEGMSGLLEFDYSGFSGYYNSLNGATTDQQVIYTFASILRNTITSYRGYSTSTEYNWVLNTTKGGQYILYDTSSFVFAGNWITTGWVSGGLGYDANGNGNYNPADGDLFVDREHIWPANNMRIKPTNNDRKLNTFTSFVLNSDASFDYRPEGTDRGHFSDLHNMWNADRNSNQALHSDRFFGNTGSTGNPNRSGSIFYPGDEYIGDIARALFYMTLTYPHLTLVNEGDPNANEGSIYYGYLNVLLEWNKLDPVSPEEIARNNKIHQNQGNRNPFIDFYYDGDFAEIFFSFGDPEVPYTA